MSHHCLSEWVRAETPAYTLKRRTPRVLHLFTSRDQKRPPFAPRYRRRESENAVTKRPGGLARPAARPALYHSYAAPPVRLSRARHPVLSSQEQYPSWPFPYLLIPSPRASTPVRRGGLRGLLAIQARIHSPALFGFPFFSSPKEWYTVR